MRLPPTLFGINLAAIKWAALAALLIGLLLASYRHGRHVAEGEIAAAQRQIALAYAGEIISNQALADHLAEENAALRTARAPKDRVIKQEVTRYEFIENPGQHCPLPGAWRLLHDAAATGQPPATEAGPMATRSAPPVTNAAALATVADNYIACRDTIAKLEAWQRRYRTLEAAHEKTD